MSMGPMMRYVPNLIPEERRVLPDYFKERPAGTYSENEFVVIAGYLIGTLSFSAALVFLRHPVLTLIFAGLGFVIFPLTRQWIERKLVFKLPASLRLIVMAVMLTIAIPIIFRYSEIDRQEVLAEEAKIKGIQSERLQADLKEKARRDSVQLWLSRGRDLLASNAFQKARSAVDKALSISRDFSEQAEIVGLRRAIGLSQAKSFVTSRKYASALPLLNELISSGNTDSELLFYRGLSHYHLGSIPQAVEDLQQAIAFGNSEANHLHDQINPLRRRVIGYITRCCDGTTSNAKGRGACSHHHGVCDWNEPIYQTYRQY